MQIIPVIDLMNGEVVHAAGGARSAYRPLRSPLAASSAPDAVVAGLLTLQGISCVYVADLDAIEGRGDQGQTIRSLVRRHAEIDFWVDAGLRGRLDLERFADYGPAVPVVGSETLHDRELLEMLPDDWVLSLDFTGDRLKGRVPLLSIAHCWPRRVIVMCLERVGSGAGPDLERVAAVRARNPGVEIYAAGGVRDRGDIECLGRAGVSGVLVGTAIHSGAVLA